MNERIKELVEQAANEYLVEQDPVTDTLSTSKRHELYQKAKEAGIAIIPNDFSKKFAELIIKECAGICMIEYDTGLEPAPQAPQIARQIKQQFGVE